MVVVGNEISQKMRSTIHAKLAYLDCNVDDELPDYVVMMVTHKRTRTQIEDDLQIFLENNTQFFVSWLYQMLKLKSQEVTVSPPALHDPGNCKERTKSKERQPKETKSKDKHIKGDVKKVKKKEKKMIHKTDEKKIHKNGKKSKRYEVSTEKESDPSVKDVSPREIWKKIGISLDSPKVETKLDVKPLVELVLPKRPVTERLGTWEDPKNETKTKDMERKERKGRKEENEKKNTKDRKNKTWRLNLKDYYKSVKNHLRETSTEIKDKTTSSNKANSDKSLNAGIKKPNSNVSVLDKCLNSSVCASEGRVQTHARVASSSSVFLRAVTDSYKSILNTLIKHTNKEVQQVKCAMMLPMRRNADAQNIVNQIPAQHEKPEKRKYMETDANIPTAKKRKAIVFDMNKKVEETEKVKTVEAKAASTSSVTLATVSTVAKTHKYDSVPHLSIADRTLVWCNMFPACRYGSACAFAHPRCKFLASCTRRSCVYSHSHTAPIAQPHSGS